MIVCKFGGSCVTAPNLPKVKQIVLDCPERRFVVASAIGKFYADQRKITDLLYEYADTKDKNVLQNIVNRHVQVANALNLNLDVEEMVRRKLIHNTDDVRYFASLGEYFSGRMVANYLGYNFVDSFDCIFFRNGELQLNSSIKALSNRLSDLPNAVICGFYGKELNGGGYATFTRGGSDISASIVAVAVDADLYENWTDVDGYLVANPKLVNNPSKLSNLSFTQLLKLNTINADVLHKDAVSPLLRSNPPIPVNIRCIYNTADYGTLISEISNNDGLIGITANDTYFYRIQCGSKSQTDLVQTKIARFNTQYLARTAFCLECATQNDLSDILLACRYEKKECCFIQALYYGKLDAQSLRNSLEQQNARVQTLAQNDDTLILIVDKNKKAVQIVYDFFNKK